MPVPTGCLPWPKAGVRACRDRAGPDHGDRHVRWATPVPCCVSPRALFEAAACTTTEAPVPMARAAVSPGACPCRHCHLKFLNAATTEADLPALDPEEEPVGPRRSGRGIGLPAPSQRLPCALSKGGAEGPIPAWMVCHLEQGTGVAPRACARAGNGPDHSDQRVK